jgi:8-oxo-dGTP pyrophosphatase MutT (NUDIX family)
MKSLLDLFYPLRRRLLRILRPRSRGVKVMLFSGAGELLLIRNTYGRTDLFVLPGGGIHPFETPAAAAAREVKEELDCGVEDLVFVSTHISAAEGRRDTIHLYHARPAGPVQADGFEVAEARFFALDALPNSTSPATLRRIDEYRGLREPDGAW